MKLGDVIKKEREKKGIEIQQAASELGIIPDEMLAIESGQSDIEKWGDFLPRIAIKLEARTSRLISFNGRSEQAAIEESQCGMLIKKRRKAKGLSQEEFAELTEIPLDEIREIERGESSLEHFAPMLLRFAEIIDQPIFNLFYPCGVAYTELENY